MKKIFHLSVILIVAILFSFSCKTSTNQEATSEKESKIDLTTQVKYEDFLANEGIVVHEKATFKELKKTNDGNYKIIYNVEPFENIQDSLQTYYENMFDEVLLQNGWQKPQAGWDPHGT